MRAPNGTDTDPLNLDPQVQAAYQHFYDLDYATAQILFVKIAAEHPTDPMAADYVLDIAVFRELYRLDLLDTTLYVQDGFLSGSIRLRKMYRSPPRLIPCISTRSI